MSIITGVSCSSNSTFIKGLALQSMKCNNKVVIQCRMVHSPLETTILSSTVLPQFLTLLCAFKNDLAIAPS